MITLSASGRTRRWEHESPVEYAYTRCGKHGFAATIDAIEQAMFVHGLVVDNVHDLHLTLAAKGFAISPIRIYEVRTGEGFWKSEPPGLDLVLPCKVSVCEERTGIVVSAIRPSLAARVFPEAHLDAVARRIEDVVLTIVDEAAGSTPAAI